MKLTHEQLKSLVEQVIKEDLEPSTTLAHSLADEFDDQLAGAPGDALMAAMIPQVRRMLSEEGVAIPPGSVTPMVQEVGRNAVKFLNNAVEYFLAEVVREAILLNNKSNTIK